MTAPLDYARRSPLYRTLEAAGAGFARLNGYAAAESFGGETDEEANAAKRLGLADLTPLRRLGFKGWNIDPWLAANGAAPGADSNRTYPQADGTRIARLGPGEVVLLGDRAGGGTLIDALDKAWSMADADGCFRVDREETSCWLLLSGAHAPAMLAKVCAVDLRPAFFTEHAIAQTNLARLNAVILRADLGGMPAYDILSDIASAAYLWEALRDAMAEFDGAPVGLAAIRALDRGEGQPNQ